MEESSWDKRFRGSVRLVIWHLWRVAESTDLEDGIAEAKSRGMISDDHESFIRKCLALNEQLEAGKNPSEPITEDLVKEMQLMAIRLNTADSA